MTARQVFLHPTFQLLGTAAVIGVMWGALKSEVGQKADRQEVATTAAALATNLSKTNADQALVIATMAADIRDIKSILCSNAPRDSMCKRRP